MKERVGQAYRRRHLAHYVLRVFGIRALDVFVEGLVLLSSLHDDYYMFEEEGFRLVARQDA